MVCESNTPGWEPQVYRGQSSASLCLICKMGHNPAPTCRVLVWEGTITVSWSRPCAQFGCPSHGGFW